MPKKNELTNDAMKLTALLTKFHKGKLPEDPMKFAALLTKLHQGKQNITVGQMRRVVKILVGLEATLHLAGYKSALMMLRKKALQKAMKMKAKAKKK